ncbi:MAG: DNA polymerase Y family protein, partial [Rhodospirillales bacterium]
MNNRRIISVFLPHFAIQRWQKRTGDNPEADLGVPVVLAREGPRGPVIHDVNLAAIRLGVRCDARVTDIRMLIPSLRVEQADQKADRQDIARLSQWCHQWCPWVRADGDNGLLLDTTGSDHLWGGETRMLSGMIAAFASLGLTARPAVAPTLGAAWALARYATTPAICRAGSIADDLSSLPVAALRLDRETVLMLRRLGLKTIGALQALPPAALVRRFRYHGLLSASPSRRLDQALGRIPEPLTPEIPAEPLRAMRQLLEPVCDASGVTYVLHDLLDELVRRLAGRNLGARRLRLAGYRVDGGVSAISAATAMASQDAGHLGRLFENRIDRLVAGFGFEIMTLDIVVFERIENAQWDLSGGTDDDVALSQLADRLIARFGHDAVLSPVATGSHLPERAGVLTPAASFHRATDKVETVSSPRPLRLLKTPEEVQVLYAVPEGPPAQLVWRRQTHRVVRSEGPERIAPEWWRQRST